MGAVVREWREGAPLLSFASGAMPQGPAWSCIVTASAMSGGVSPFSSFSLRQVVTDVRDVGMPLLQR